MQSAGVEKAWRQEWEAAGHGAAAVRKQRENSAAQPAFFLLQPWSPAYVMMKPKVGLPSSAKPVWKCSQRPVEEDFHGDSESHHIGNEDEAVQGACL